MGWPGRAHRPRHECALPAQQTPDQELTLLVDLRSLNVAMFASSFLVLWGLRGEGPSRPGSRSPC
jgi:hypothetical protein